MLKQAHYLKNFYLSLWAISIITIQIGSGLTISKQINDESKLKENNPSHFISQSESPIFYLGVKDPEGQNNSNSCFSQKVLQVVFINKKFGTLKGNNENVISGYAQIKDLSFVKIQQLFIVHRKLVI